MTIKNATEGFTIVELMIAISILSLILVMSTLALMGIGDYYTKGVNITNIQDDSRNITNELSSDIQFSSTTMTTPAINPVSYNGTTVYASCFGDTRYSYAIGFSNAEHSLWRDKMINVGNCYPLNLTEPIPSCDGNSSCPNPVVNSGSDLLANNIHLSKLSIQPLTAANDVYSINIALALGSTRDLFQTNSFGNPIIINGNYSCLPNIGEEYCAISSLATIVTRRIGTQ